MRKATGTVKYDDAKGCYRAKLTLSDGSRSPWIDLDPGPKSPTAKRSAQGKAAGLTERARAKGLTRADFPSLAKLTTGELVPVVAAGETCDQWFARYDAFQRECGQTDPTKGTRWRKWISPRIGPRPMVSITRDDVENIRDVLDESILAWKVDGRADDRVSGRTAMNIWSCVTSSFKAAASSKRRDLRVLEGKPNPCIGVEPPGDQESRLSRQKTFVYPKECAALLACKAIPIEWREIHAIAAYSYLRPGELRVLTFGDVDLAAGLIHVTKAWDYSEAINKAPKTRKGIRRVPIEPSLAPVLKRMSEGKEATALVVPTMSSVPDNSLAESFREHLTIADLKRAELHATTATHVQSNFRSWRDSGITWLAMSGVGVDKICRRAGHQDINTTMGYVKQAEDLTGDLGTPFGPLPPSLLGEEEATGTPGDDGESIVPESSGSPESEALPSIPAHVAAVAMAGIAGESSGSAVMPTDSNPLLSAE